MTINDNILINSKLNIFVSRNTLFWTSTTARWDGHAMDILVHRDPTTVASVLTRLNTF